MLDVIRRGQRWVTAIFVVGIGSVFVFYLGGGGGIQRGGDALIQVGEIRIDNYEYGRFRDQQEQRYRDALGEQFDARKYRDTLDDLTTRLVVERAIMALEAEALGLSVPKQELERQILEIGGFRNAAGRFDKQAFDNWVGRTYGSERAFREQQSRAVLVTKLIRVIRAQAVVSDGEVRTALKRKLEEIRIVTTVLDTSEVLEGYERDEQAIAAVLATRVEDVSALYEARQDEFDVPEQTRARHILVRVPPNADEATRAELKAKARAAQQRVLDGEDFAAVAKQVSEDPEAKANGGDLGFFKRGQMAPAFDAVAFAIEPGTVSELVKTDFGYHIIWVEERKAAQVRTFDDVKRDLAFDLLSSEAARDETLAQAARIADAVRGGQSLEAAARAEERTLNRSGWLRRRPDGYVPGLGASPELMAVAFTLEAGQSSDRTFKIGDRLALVQVLERQQADPDEIEQQLQAERERLRNQKMTRLLDTWVNERRNQLAKEGELVVDMDLIRG